MRRSCKKQKQHGSQGFTLIELVMVIVIFASLSVFALPRFANLTSESTINSTRYIAASYQQSVKTVKAVFVAKANTTRIQNLTGFGDNTIDTNNIGYPIGIDKGNGNENIGRGDEGCVGLWNGLLDNPPTVSSTDDDSDFRSYRHTGSRVCSYVYRRNGDLGDFNTGELIIRYDSRNGNVTLCGQLAEIPDC